MYAPIEMHDMSFWKVVQNSPEWITVFSTILFAAITSYIIWRQKCVMQQQVKVTKEQGEDAARIMQEQVKMMEKQGEISARHEQMQNRLLQLQHEHEWLTVLNAKRYEILKIATKLHVDVLYLIKKVDAGQDAMVWSRMLELRSELKVQMEILDVAAYTKDKDGWYAKLGAWVTELFSIIGESLKSPIYSGVPADSTRKALAAAETTYDPVKPMYALQTLIRETTEEFNKKWATETSTV